MGGEDYTRSVDPQENDDPRKTIPQGESFEDAIMQEAFVSARDNVWDVAVSLFERPSDSKRHQVLERIQLVIEDKLDERLPSRQC